jgi:hypothetical protein
VASQVELGTAMPEPKDLVDLRRYPASHDCVSSLAERQPVHQAILEQTRCIVPIGESMFMVPGAKWSVALLVEEAKSVGALGQCAMDKRPAHAERADADL